MATLHHAERLAPLYPRFTSIVLKLADNLYQSKGEELIVVQGIRTWVEQDAIWAKGRTVMSDISCTHNGHTFRPGTCSRHPLGATVTNARGGYSWHNFGVAVDLAPLNKDKSIDWNSSHPQWRDMEEAGVTLGLTSGAHWQRIVDAPHFQITGSFPIAAPNDAARAIVYQGNQTVKDHGLQAFWLAVDKSYTVTTGDTNKTT